MRYIIIYVLYVVHLYLYVFSYSMFIILKGTYHTHTVMYVAHMSYAKQKKTSHTKKMLKFPQDFLHFI